MAAWQDRMGAKGYPRYPLPSLPERRVTRPPSHLSLSPALLKCSYLALAGEAAPRKVAVGFKRLSLPSRADRSGLYFHYTPIFDATDGPMRAGGRGHLAEPPHWEGMGKIFLGVCGDIDAKSMLLICRRPLAGAAALGFL